MCFLSWVGKISSANFVSQPALSSSLPGGHSDSEPRCWLRIESLEVEIFAQLWAFLYLCVRRLWAKNIVSHVFTISPPPKSMNSKLHSWALSDLSTSEPRTPTSELFGAGRKLHSILEEQMNGIRCSCLCNDVSPTCTPVLQGSRKRTCLCVCVRTALAYIIVQLWITHSTCTVDLWRTFCGKWF